MNIGEVRNGACLKPNYEMPSDTNFDRWEENIHRSMNVLFNIDCATTFEKAFIFLNKNHIAIVHFLELTRFFWQTYAAREYAGELFVGKPRPSNLSKQKYDILLDLHKAMPKENPTREEINLLKHIAYHVFSSLEEELVFALREAHNLFKILDLREYDGCDLPNMYDVLIQAELE